MFEITFGKYINLKKGFTDLEHTLYPDHFASGKFRDVYGAEISKGMIPG